MEWPPRSPRTPLAVALVLVLCAGCKGSLPSAPSDLTTGVIIYEHQDYQGQSAHITEDISDLGEFTGPCAHSIGSGEDETDDYDWSDCISSVRVAPGWSAIIYDDPDYRDDAWTITVDVPNLKRVPGDCSKGGLTDCVSSIRVMAPTPP
jgi:hypothetical protein